MWRGISLANKCLLLFGAAVMVTIVAALSIPWLRMNSLVDEAQRDLSRQLVEVWQERLRNQPQPPPEHPLIRTPRAEPRPGEPEQLADATIRLLKPDEIAAAGGEDPFVARAWKRFSQRPEESDFYGARWIGTAREYRYARAVRGRGAGAEEGPAEMGTLQGMVVLTRTSGGAAGLLLVNTAYLFSAGLIALGVAVLIFYLITTRLILGPVRSLRETAEMVREGNLATRADIQTGDEFEELGDTFNQMLGALAETQDQLRAINKNLDLKVNELAERNVALYEANKLKGEFLANVSHELRTPLNSIIGFCELLLEICDKEEAAGDDSSRLLKRKRYLENILNSGRSLLEMINTLLDMAKIEAGKMELRVEPINVRDLCEALLALIRPLADRGGVELVLDAAPDLPLLETDAKKLQQIVFNLLSNAVKFTAEQAGSDRPSRGGSAGGDGQKAGAGRSGARVTLRAERLVGRASEGRGAADRLRISVIDTGPGIAPEDRQRIFEKFQQIDSGHTRRHTGTGLGLAIVKELSGLLQAEIDVDSEPGRGSMFSVILPLSLDPGRAAEMKLEMDFRGRLAAQR